ncbi:hypothetical protein B0G82_2880 [Paraburkholderia sp. BL17N1]|nr:hypothetical protein B0G82_2880 [Paraburkholderia sp. BL17N1]
MVCEQTLMLIELTRRCVRFLPLEEVKTAQPQFSLTERVGRSAPLSYDT